jgi:hypothetical protein
MAGNSSIGSSACDFKSSGILRASFQMHLRTSSATLASRDSVLVPFTGNGLTVWSRRRNRALWAHSGQAL